MCLCQAGQEYNRELLSLFLQDDSEAFSTTTKSKIPSLADIELLRHSAPSDARAVAFGEWAGRVGVGEALFAFGVPLHDTSATEGDRPTTGLQRPYEFESFAAYKDHVARLGNLVRAHGCNKAFKRPLLFGLTG